LLHFFIVFEHFFESRLASPLTVATQLCFATHSGDAAVLRHSQWRRTFACCAWRWRSCLLCFATHRGDAALLRHSQWRRSSASPLPVATQAWIYGINSKSSFEYHISQIKHDHISKKIIYHIAKKIKLSYIIEDHIKERRSFVSVKLMISYIIYDHIIERSSSQYHNIIIS
jgi:hypothetical protein